MLDNPFERFNLEVDLEKYPDKPVALLTHGVPLHADDALSIMLIIKEATSEWVGKHVVKGVAQLDIPGSVFCDKQDIKDKEKKESMCIKVARSLGVLDDPKWSKIIEFVNRDDLNGGTDQTSIVSLLKQGQQQKPEEAMDICFWFLDGLTVKMEYEAKNKNMSLPHMAELFRQHNIGFADEWIERGEQINKNRQIYFDLAKQELLDKLDKGEVLKMVVKYRGKEIVIAGVKSDNYRMQTVIRSILGHVAIIKGRSGVLINSRSRADINMGEIMAVIRYMESQKAGGMIWTRNEQPELRDPGTINLVSEWFFNTTPTPPMIMNSLSHDAQLTKLSLSELVQCAAIALDDNRYHPDKNVRSFCEQGICKLGMACPNLRMGLKRCVKIFTEQ